jgi:cation diffusion facilitator family transporter
MSASHPHLSAGVQRTCVTHGDFLGVAHERNERRTWAVVLVTALMMFGEIIGGTVYGSMALVADGWHMATHAAALSVAALAYGYARRHISDPRFTFGTGKIGELTGFASAIVLGMISLLIGWESLTRLINPHPIDFAQATWIAMLGLAVNLVSAALLHQGEHHHDHDEHDHDVHAHDDHDHHEAETDDDNFGHAHHHRDNNLRAAYLHVVADAMTSVLAIAGLLTGRYLGWVWMDPLMGIVGALVIAHWSWGLMRSAGTYLVDMNRDPQLLEAVRSQLEVQGDVIRDLHLWRIGPGHHAVVVAIDSAQPQPPATYRARLASIPSLSHVTVEVNRCG